jgi:hypothetical protein
VPVTPDDKWDPRTADWGTPIGYPDASKAYPAGDDRGLPPPEAAALLSTVYLTLGDGTSSPGTSVVGSVKAPLPWPKARIVAVTAYTFQAAPTPTPGSINIRHMPSNVLVWGVDATPPYVGWPQQAPFPQTVTVVPPTPETVYEGGHFVLVTANPPGNTGQVTVTMAITLQKVS